MTKRDLEAIYDDLKEKLGRHPSLQELCEEAGIDERDYSEIMFESLEVRVQ